MGVPIGNVSSAWRRQGSEGRVARYRLAVIEGDGIGREVIPEGLAAIRAAAEVTGSFAIETVD